MEETGQLGRKAQAGMTPARCIAAGLAVILLAGGPAAVAASKPAQAAASRPAKQHRVVILIDSDDERVMGHAISYSLNLTRAYAAKHEAVRIEIVANGSGIRLFRDDTSPLQKELAAVRQMAPDIVFSMCDSSRQIAQEREGHPIGLVPDARLVPFGIGRVAQLEEAGWAYIHG